jgi:glutamate racemase
LIPQIKKILPENIQIIDSGRAVAKQTQNILKEQVGLSSTTSNEAVFYTNTNPKVLQGILKNKFPVIEKDF